MERLMDFLRSANDGLLGESFQNALGHATNCPDELVFFVPCFRQVTVVAHVQAR